MRSPCFLHYNGHLVRGFLVQRTKVEYVELPDGLILLPEAYEIEDVVEVESDEDVVHLGF